MGRNRGSIFEELSNTFVSTVECLSPQHKDLLASCKTPDDLVKQLSEIDSLKKARRRETQWVGSIRRIIERLAPYFEVIDTLVSCDPIHAATIWGGLRVVLQLASNFATFFEKIMKCLDRIAEIFPIYERIERLFESQPPGLQSSLEHLYTDLFRFLSEVLRVFCKPTGGIKSTARVIAATAWKPFDEVFGEITEDMEFHRGLLNQEISYLQMGQLRTTGRNLESEIRKAEEERKQAAVAREKIRDMLEQQWKDMTFDRLQKWLDPPEFAERFEDSLAAREDSTAEWIFKDKTYEQWSQQLEPTGHKERLLGSNVLWINGK
ncbi:hypothetical protein ABZX51_003519 [Aspergillus tubingensis]